MPTMLMTSVPFAGFYYSEHDLLLDDALEQLFWDDDGNVNAALMTRAFEACKWGEVQKAYAKAYVENFAAEFGVKLEFDELSSPREYNFTTDRIFARIPLEEVYRLRRATKVLDEVAAEMFTSRSGFISYYSSDVASWGAAKTWDLNQVGALLAAYVRQIRGGDLDQYAEVDLMEQDRGNGELENWISEATPGIERLFRVHDYLRRRQERLSRVSR